MDIVKAKTCLTCKYHFIKDFTINYCEYNVGYHIRLTKAAESVCGYWDAKLENKQPPTYTRINCCFSCIHMTNKPGSSFPYHCARSEYVFDNVEEMCTHVCGDWKLK